MAAAALQAWLGRLTDAYADRILPIDRAIAERWGSLSVPDPVPTVDGLLAATALEHGLTLVTRSTRDVAALSVPVLDPFAGTPGGRGGSDSGRTRETGGGRGTPV